MVQDVPTSICYSLTDPHVLTLDGRYSVSAFLTEGLKQCAKCYHDVMVLCESNRLQAVRKPADWHLRLVSEPGAAL